MPYTFVKKFPLQKQSYWESSNTPVLKISLVPSFSKGYALLTWKHALGEKFVNLPPTL